MYNIIGGNEGFTFQIYPPHSGIVVTTLPLDYEIQDSYSLTIEAVDHGQPPLSSTCTLNIAVVDINDQRPKFPDPMPVNLSEGKCLLQTPNITRKSCMHNFWACYFWSLSQAKSFHGINVNNTNIFVTDFCLYR